MKKLLKKRNKKFIISGTIILAIALTALIYFNWEKINGSERDDLIASINGKFIYFKDIKPFYNELKEKYKDRIKRYNPIEVDRMIKAEAVYMYSEKYLL